MNTDTIFFHTKYKYERISNKIVQSFVEKKEVPNIIIQGPQGCGKYTQIMVVLDKCFGHLCSPYNVKAKAISISTGEIVYDRKNTDDKYMFCLVSKIHCEIDLQQLHSNKGLLPFLDYYTRTKNIHFNTYKYIVLRNIEYINYETQNALRRLIEIYHEKVRFLITTKSISKIIFPLRSRFIIIPCKPPNEEEVYNMIKYIVSKENITISDTNIYKMIEKSKVGSAGFINLHEVFVILEGSVIISNDNNITKIYDTDKNVASSLLINAIVNKSFGSIRNILYDIYEKQKDDFENIITCDFFNKCLPLINDSMKKEFVKKTAEWNKIINNKYILEPIFQAEAYIYTVYKIYHMS